jgi:peptidyl-prolyl cis-trans isomerase A (cyclophilin A)
VKDCHPHRRAPLGPTADGGVGHEQPPASAGLVERSPVTEPLPANLLATLHTNRGDIRIRLFANHAPKTVRNFVGLAEGTQEWQDPQNSQLRRDPFYDGLVFHRVITGFMIQGGCPLGTGTGGPGYTFDDEIHPELTFTKTYLLAMANAGKRMGKGTNGSQFFITVAPTPHLQGKHTIFGEVVDEDSRKVVDAIATTPTDPRDRPIDPVVIQRVTIERG